MKKFSSFVLCLILFISTFLVAIASEADNYLWNYYRDHWEITDVWNSGSSYNGDSWHHFYTDYPAERAGETDTISISVTYGSEVSGSIAVSLDAIEDAVGFALYNDVGFSVSKTSDILNAGEYIKGYWRKCYNKKTVVQTGTRDGIGWEQDEEGMAVDPVLSLTDVSLGTKYCYAYEPIMPQLKISYFNLNNAQSASQQVRTEIFTYIDGSYVLTDQYYETVNSSAYQHTKPPHPVTP